MQFVRSGIGRVLRHLLEKRGYVVEPKQGHRWGANPWQDISALSAAWGIPVKVICDIGANVGQTSLTVATQFSDARVFAFEPHPRIFERLKANVAALPRIVPVNSAVGAEVGEVSMFDYGDTSLTGSLVENAQFAVRTGAKAQPIPVACTTFDTFCKANGLGRVDVLKIDTEGFDLVVLQGAGEMLSSGGVSFVVVEFNDLRPADGATGGALLPIDELLRPNGFKLVATYSDWLDPAKGMFAVSNALFARPPA